MFCPLNADLINHHLGLLIIITNNDLANPRSTWSGSLGFDPIIFYGSTLITQFDICRILSSEHVSFLAKIIHDRTRVINWTDSNESWPIFDVVPSYLLIFIAVKKQFRPTHLISFLVSIIKYVMLVKANEMIALNIKHMLSH